MNCLIVDPTLKLKLNSIDKQTNINKKISKLIEIFRIQLSGLTTLPSHSICIYQ